MRGGAERRDERPVCGAGRSTDYPRRVDPKTRMRIVTGAFVLLLVVVIISAIVQK